MNLTKKQTEEVLSKFLGQKNGLNEVLQMMLNAMMYNERSEHLVNLQDNKANGFRLGKVFGYGSQIELRIPRDRQSNFMPTILALFRDQESYIKEVSFQLYSKGLTTRDISEVMKTIYGTRYSKSTISNISQSFYEQMEAWRNRSLESHYLALYIDGIQVKLKRDKLYKNESFYIILGLKEDYTREVIAIINFPSESAQGWKQVFSLIKQRGVKSIGLFVSDGLTGLEKAIANEFSATPHQKCIVHLQRALQSYVRREDKEELAADVRYLLSPDDALYTKEQVPERLSALQQKWKAKYKSLGKYLEVMEWQSYFTFLDYHTQIRRMIYTTNWIERFNKSCRRTLKIRGAFPNEDSVLALITSVAVDKSEKQYKYPIYNFKFEPKLVEKKHSKNNELINLLKTF
ncbi:MAG: IS256 family transposase [Mesoflavibacter sp.]|nr:IS256 family transposase [Mesoflavibacter sp.]